MFLFGVSRALFCAFRPSSPLPDLPAGFRANVPIEGPVRGRSVKSGAGLLRLPVGSVCLVAN